MVESFLINESLLKALTLGFDERWFLFAFSFV